MSRDKEYNAHEITDMKYNFFKDPANQLLYLHTNI